MACGREGAGSGRSACEAEREGERWGRKSHEGDVERCSELKKLK